MLREAVAAQTRRRIRDAFLLVLLVIFISVNFTLAIFWAALVGLAIALLTIGRNRRMIASAMLATSSGGGLPVVTGARGWLASGDGRDRRTLVLAVIALGLVIGVPLFFLIFILGTTLDSELGGTVILDLFPAGIWPTVVFGLLLLVVLMVDEFTVAKLMTSSFRRGRFDPDIRNTSSGWERSARSLGHNSFRAGLQRVARTDESSLPAGQADVIVYRDYTPFVGAGDVVEHHAIALPLEPSEDESDDNPVPINVNDLHRHVTECLAALRSPSSLSPGRRLEQLRHREQVLVPADRLLFNQFAQLQPPILSDLRQPPLAQLPLGVARMLAENQLEWARYYSCFRVESWDRDLTTSCYLHIGTDQRMLYLEWTYCVLLPVSERYRAIDRVRRWLPFARSLVEWVILPATVIQRLRSAFRRHTVLVQRPGEVIPDRYGAAKSLRELAADTEVQAYFQEVDVERYISIIDRALFRAVGQFLEQRGYSVAEFTKMADSVVNNFIEGNVVNSVIGSGNKNVRINATRSGGSKGAK